MRRTFLLLASIALVVLLASGVALALTKQCRGHDRCFGTREDDRLLGSPGDNNMVGRDGNDTLKGFDGRDRLYGSEGNDRLVGGNKGDQLFGGPGRDELQGGLLTDLYTFASAGWGNDTIIETDDGLDAAVAFKNVSAGLIIDMNSDPEAPEARTVAGRSTVDWSGNSVGNVKSSGGDDSITGRTDSLSDIRGGGGDDTIRVANGTGRDRVDCGPGVDTVFYDLGDTLIQCEVQNLLAG